MLQRNFAELQGIYKVVQKQFRSIINLNCLRDIMDTLHFLQFLKIMTPYQ